MGRIGPTEIIIIAVLIILIFGWKRLPDAARSLGRSARVFKSEVDGRAPPPRYFGDSDDRFELLGMLPARFNRLAIYRGSLLHSAIVVEKRETLKSWTILLAIIAFGFSLIGTFIVRSGVITSVHSFASDPTRGVFILGILAAFVGGALTLFTARAGAMTARGVFAPVSREGALLLNNLLLAVAAFVVFIGTIWPLVAEMAWNRKLSVLSLIHI